MVVDFLTEFFFYSIIKTLSIDEQQKIACGQRE